MSERPFKESCLAAQQRRVDHIEAVLRCFSLIYGLRRFAYRSQAKTQWLSQMRRTGFSAAPKLHSDYKFSLPFTPFNVILVLPFQPIDATHCANFSAGLRYCKVLRGLSLSCRATAFSFAWLWADKSVPFGKYCRNNRLVFSLVPRCQGL